MMPDSEDVQRLLYFQSGGLNALEIARSCTDLPYLSYVLELLLHEVLDPDSATSKDYQCTGNKYYGNSQVRTKW